MRVQVSVYISEGGFTYSREGQVNRDATFEAESESLGAIPWGLVLGGLVESALAEFEVQSAARELEELEGE